MPFRLATTLAACFSSGSSALRNLAAQRSMGPSMLTSTVSLALDESFWTSAGILMSCARAYSGIASSTGNRAKNIVDNRARESLAIVMGNFLFLFLFLFVVVVVIVMGLFPFLPVLGLVRVALVGIDLIGIDLVDPRPSELELASGDAKSHKQALFRSLSLDPLTLNVAVVDAAEHQGRGNDSE